MTDTAIEQVKPRKPILSLDFDGVCHMYTSGWKGAAVIPDPSVPGLFEFIDSCLPYFDVQIFSSRSNQDGGREAMREWFIKERFAYINAGKFTHENDAKEAEQWVEHLAFPLSKPPAFLGIDDRVLNFRGEWPDIEELRGYKTWTENPLGATNRHPRGKLNSRDEGELRLGIAHSDGTVIVDFGKSVAWIGLDPRSAHELADLIHAHAAEVENA